MRKREKEKRRKEERKGGWKRLGGDKRASAILSRFPRMGRSLIPTTSLADRDNGRLSLLRKCCCKTQSAHIQTR